MSRFDKNLFHKSNFILCSFCTVLALTSGSVVADGFFASSALESNVKHQSTEQKSPDLTVAKSEQNDENKGKYVLPSSDPYVEAFHSITNKSSQDKHLSNYAQNEQEETASLNSSDQQSSSSKEHKLKTILTLDNSKTVNKPESLSESKRTLLMNKVVTNNLNKTEKRSLFEQFLGEKSNEEAYVIDGANFVKFSFVEGFDKLKELNSKNVQQIIASLPRDLSKEKWLQASQIKDIDTIYNQLSRGLSYLSYLLYQNDSLSSHIQIPFIVATYQEPEIESSRVQQELNSKEQDDSTLSFNTNSPVVAPNMSIVQNPVVSIESSVAHPEKNSLSDKIANQNVGNNQQTQVPPIVYSYHQDSPTIYNGHELESGEKFFVNRLLYGLDSFALMLDSQYSQGECAGMRMIEADLKGKCKLVDNYNGLVALTISPKEILQAGIYEGVALHLPINREQKSLFTSALITAAYFVGVNSSLHTSQEVIGGNKNNQDQKQKYKRVESFGEHLTSFDQHLYSANTKSFITPKQKLSSLGARCSIQNQSDCNLYFVGENVSKLLSLGNSTGSFNVNNTESSKLYTPIDNGEQTPNVKTDLEADISAKQTLASVDKENRSNVEKVETQAKTKSELFGVPIRFSLYGQPQFALRNTLLSYGDFKNYGFFTEIELNLLKDLGYKLEPKDFYGTSIYSFGSDEQPITRLVSSDFAYYDEKEQKYVLSNYSSTPGAVGVHIYGSKNKIIHGANILASGFGAIGVRIDGSENSYLQSPITRIITKGENATGIAFTYGRDNQAVLSGYTSALAQDGIAVKVDMGSNVYSDILENRGSYIRNRSLDYYQGVRDKASAQAVPLLNDLNGPQVSELTIDGVLEGNKAAIWIDNNSFVKQINLTSSAFIRGNIISNWSPKVGNDGHLVVKRDDSSDYLLDSIVQYKPQNTSLSPEKILDYELSTRLNLGVLLDERNQIVRYQDSQNRIRGNSKSKISVFGNVKGDRLKVYNIEGVSTLVGSLDVASLNVLSGIFRLNNKRQETNTLGSLDVHAGAILDLADGNKSHLIVNGDIAFGRNASVRVDVDSQGNIVDTVDYHNDFYAWDYQLSVEPAVSFEELRRLSSDPKNMYNFIKNFLSKANERFGDEDVSIRFPKYIWDNSGHYGREIKCNARGCRTGGFISSDVLVYNDYIPTWRYYVSFGGIFLFIVGFYCYFYLGRYFKAKRKN